MQLFNLAGMLAFSIACLAVGLRLLLLARTTRKLPESLMGAALVSGGFLGYLITIILEVVEPAPALELVLLALARILIGGASAAVVVAGWRIFSPDRPWAGVAVGVLLTLHLPYLTRDFWFTELAPTQQLQHPLFWGWTLARIACYLWMSVASFQAQLQIRRRWHMGLTADRTLASRMLLWALGTGAIAAMFAAIAVYHVVDGTTDLTATSHRIIAVLGIFCAVCLWLAFFSPHTYLKRVEERATPEVA